MTRPTWIQNLILLSLTIISTSALSQTFSTADIGALPKYYDSRALWADIDSDGDADLVLTGASQTPVSIYKNMGGALTLYTSTNLPTLLNPILGAADFNKDGYVDLVMSGIVKGGSDRSVLGGGVYLNDGTGLFTQSPASLVALTRGSVDCADFDLDGDVDILMTGYDKTQEVRTVIMMNNDDGSFTELKHQLPGVGGNPESSGTWGDYDRDGDPDILLSGQIYTNGNPEGLTQIFINNGDRTFSEASVSLTQYWGKSTWVDVNNDGALDIFVSGYAMGVTSPSQLYLNQSGAFIDGPAIAAERPFPDFHWVDFDNDGDKDLLAAEGDAGVISIYTNNGGTSFTKLDSFNPPNHTQTSIADFDSDGHYDIFLSGDTDGFTASNLALRNDSSTPNVAPNAPANFTANNSGREVAFSWDMASDAESSASSLEYLLRIGTSAGSSDVVSPLTTPAGQNLVYEFEDTYQTTSHSIFDLPDGTYYASVQALDPTGKTSVSSDEVTFTVTNPPVVPASPGNLHLAITTTNFVELDWIDQSANESSFEIERSDDGVTFQSLTTVAKNTMTYVDKTVELAKTYYYRLKAVNGTGSSDYTATQAILNPKGLFRKLEGFELPSTETDPSISVDWVDYNSDGFDDLFMASAGGTNFLYQNVGDGSFQRIATGQLITGGVQNRKSCWADYDNDGDMDVFVPTSFNGRLFRNDGGTFTEVVGSPFDENTTDCGGASWVDYDNDGFLDLSVVYIGSASHLYHNNGDGTFSKVAAGAFSQDVGSFASIAWCDFNGDGWQDALALNYGGQSILYKNTKGVFTRVTAPVTSAGSAAVTASWGDYDNDGDFDVFIGNNVNVSDAFFENNGNGSFTRISNATTEAYVQSNGSAWGDIDNDGDLDLFLTGDTERTLFLNNGDGSFQMQADEPATSGTRYTEAVALSDYDKDGFLDAAFPSYWGDPAVLRNNGNSDNHWVSFKLQGTSINRNAIGAKIMISSGGKVRANYVASQTGHSSQNSFNVHFGLGTSTTIDSVAITWPLRGFQSLTDIAADQFMTIMEPTLPAIPILTNVLYDSMSQTVSVAWDPVPGATQYLVARSVGDQDHFQTVAIQDLTEFSEDMPVELDSVSYRLRAAEDNAASWYSDAKTVFCGLRSPENVQATVETDGIRLRWNDMSQQEDHYEIFRSTNGVDFEKIAEVDKDVVQFKDPAATEEETTYYYLLEAVNGDVRSRNSDTTSVTRPLNAPSDLSITLNGGSVVLHWIDNSQKETSYVIERSIGNDQQFEIIGTVGPNTVEFTDEDFSIGQQLFYRIMIGNAEDGPVYSSNVNMLVSGIGESIAQVIAVYPNPASGPVSVRAPGGEKLFSLTNMMGGEVMRVRSTRQVTELDVTRLPPGIYMLTTQIAGHIERRRLTIKGF